MLSLNGESSDLNERTRCAELMNLSFSFNSVLNCAAFFALDSELREAYLHHFQAREMAICASDSWFELSRSRYNEFHMSSGDFFLNWKDKGYVTLFDVLTVGSLIDFNIEIKVTSSGNLEKNRKQRKLHPTGRPCSS